jgi:hypothetical protein
MARLSLQFGFAVVLGAISLLDTKPVGAQVTASQVQKYVTDVIENYPHSIKPANLRIDRKYLYYDFGSFIRPQDWPASPTDLPTASQFQVELLRRYPGWGPLTRRTLETYLVRAETIIMKELSLISTFNGIEEDLYAGLREYEQHVNDVLMDAVSNFARREGRQVRPLSDLNLAQRRSPRPTCHYQNTTIEGFRVEMKTMPAGGTIFYMPAGKYIVARFEKKLEQKDLWNYATETQILNGAYYFRAEWSDGSTRNPVRILVDHETTLTLRPETKANPAEAK